MTYLISTGVNNYLVLIGFKAPVTDQCTEPEKRKETQPKSITPISKVQLGQEY